jgi:hypothetical protein
MIKQTGHEQPRRRSDSNHHEDDNTLSRAPATHHPDPLAFTFPGPLGTLASFLFTHDSSSRSMPSTADSPPANPLVQPFMKRSPGTTDQPSNSMIPSKIPIPAPHECFGYPHGRDTLQIGHRAFSREDWSRFILGTAFGEQTPLKLSVTIDRHNGPLQRVHQTIAQLGVKWWKQQVLFRRLLVG